MSRLASRLRVVAALAVAGLVTLLNPAAHARGQSQRPVFRAGADGVELFVSVRAGDRPVDGLTADDFEVLDNGVPQLVQSASTGGVPLDAVVAVDTSGSTADSLGDFKRRVQAMLDLLGPRDRIALITFSNFVHEVFSLRPAALVDEATLSSVRTEGATTARNAVVASIILSPEEPGRRRLVVIFTDGHDTASTMQSTSMLDVVRRSDVTVHVGGAAADADIDDVVDVSGGRVHRTGAMVRVFQEILDEARGSYILRYVPSGVAIEGWHDLAVRVRTSERYEVRARRGYFGG